MALQVPKALSFLVLPTFLLILTLPPASSELMAYEPVEHLKGHLEHLPFDEGEIPWRQFLGLQPRELKNATKTITKNLISTLDQVTSVRLLKGENVLIEKLATGVTCESSVMLPPANILSLLGLTIPILLEDYKPETLSDPIGKLLKGVHLEHPLVKGRESLSLLDLIKDLPKTKEEGGTGVFTDPDLLTELGNRGDLAVFVVNSVLGSLSAEAWLDAFLSAGMERTKFSNEGNARVVTSLTEIGYFAAAISHDATVSSLPPKSDLFSLDNDRFLFNWWFNCPSRRIEESECLLPLAPAGTIFNLSPQLRIYVLPNLDLALIVANHSKPSTEEKATEWTPSVAELVKGDRRIWKQFYSVIDPSFKEEEGGGPELTEEERSILAESIHTLWPALLFIFFIFLSHVWVYWIFHGLWYVLSFVSSKVYVPRPKTAKEE